jgi:hypothetical protein
MWLGQNTNCTAPNIDIKTHHYLGDGKATNMSSIYFILFKLVFIFFVVLLLPSIQKFMLFFSPLFCIILP